MAGRLRRDRRHADQEHRRRPPELPAAASSAPSPRIPTSSTSPRPRSCSPRPACPNGFKVTMDMRTRAAGQRHRQAIQQTWPSARASSVEILPGDGKQTLTKYRARTHDIYIGQWGAGLSGSAHQRRHVRAQPGQRRRREVEAARLAQRLGDPRAHEARPDAAVLERDAGEARGDVRGDAGASSARTARS